MYMGENKKIFVYIILYNFAIIILFPCVLQYHRSNNNQWSAQHYQMSFNCTWTQEGYTYDTLKNISLIEKFLRENDINLKKI